MEPTTIFPVREHIPFLQAATDIIPIDKGYSSDKKYKVIVNNEPYLLKTFASSHLQAKRNEYDILQKMTEIGVKCSRPVELGHVPDMGFGYQVLTYLEGEDAADQLPLYSEEEQYRIGLEAGQLLLAMHQYEAPPSIAPWEDRKLRKHRRYMERYPMCGAKVTQEERVIAFIERHLPLMKGRPNLFQHDDFHVGNLIVRDGSLTGVIDFNRMDWGDPVHEFLKAGMFSAEVSVPFSIGQIRGYHQGRDPDEQFWMLYSLYLAMSTISSAVWISEVKPEETDMMMAKVDRMLDDHHGFERIRPDWYQQQM
ncbi:aminoglycoside phosphotransferase family protein [Paenibacillus sp. y28]|uniref:aminoglycoside phosphotransferase family protein n=1 Tax=Paenibacillus sp. y28 TaxID=3129110 RepID=UPI0030172785